MKSNALTAARQWAHRSLRQALARLPRETRFALYRRLAQCDPHPPADLVLKIAETQDELEACFGLLHDAYVASGFMRPHPSGLRVTAWHALPTTTTVCAQVGGEVVGTLSMVREGVFGLPLQSAFDLAPVRRRPGQLAEISALAVRRDYRRTGGAVLFPLMKFMYEYCTRYFDTRHLLIAVNPDKVELYEALLFFQRLSAQTVDHYDFANGAPAVGAVLDLQGAPAQFRRAYHGRPERRDLHRYFTLTQLPQIQLPQRPYFTTNDPVMTPALLDHFFNQRTQGFQALDARQRRLLHSIYDGPAYRDVLPALDPQDAGSGAVRRHQRHSIKCPGWLCVGGAGQPRRPLNLVEISHGGCRVELGAQDLPLQAEAELTVALGEQVRSRVQARVVRYAGGGAWGLAVPQPDAAWQACVQALEGGTTYRDLSVLSAGASPVAAWPSPASPMPPAGAPPVPA